MKKKIAASSTMFVSHIEAVQNVVRLQKASCNAALDTVSSVASSNSTSIEEVGGNICDYS